MAFYDRFVELCIQKGVSPSAAARAVGLTTANPTYWKRGSIPKGDTLQKLADYFDVTVDDLLAEKRALGIRVGGKIIAPGGIKSKYGIYAGGGIESDGPVEIGLVIQGELARAVKAMEQMPEEGRKRVADYAEDILPRYLCKEIGQPSYKTSDEAPPPPTPDTPGMEKPTGGAENGE